MARVWQRRYDPDDPVLTKVVESTEHLPEASEEETWGITTLRVRRGLFGCFGGGLEEERRWLVFKPVASEREALLADPRFSVPSHFKSWLELDLETRPDWDEVRELLTDSYTLVAPKELADRVGGRPE
ncbi:MAG: MmcQ/YjbR family DNA-binding protein [Bifidobacteriaceae bacterium]|jgi:predicted DNA-binding protein (MmcQ/YjbR family)|nr:MmcQ/YjbR family DNA-binding protein [Bifidobacteriaceae bacterium]